jgi:hypothetical protein
MCCRLTNRHSFLIWLPAALRRVVGIAIEGRRTPPTGCRLLDNGRLGRWDVTSLQRHCGTRPGDPARRYEELRPPLARHTVACGAHPLQKARLPTASKPVAQDTQAGCVPQA